VTIIANCAPPQTVTETITTSPANLKVTIDGGSAVVAPQAANWAPGSSHTLGAPSPQLNAAGDTQYTFSPPWTASVGAITSSGAVASAPSTTAVYTANFTTAYKVTLVLNGCAVGQLSPPGLSSSAPVFVAANSFVQVAISAAASLPNVFQNFVVTPSTNATVAQNSVSISPLTGPVTITANCGPPTVVAETITTSPANLKVTIDGGAAVTAPQTVNWTPASNHTLGAPSPQLNAAGDTQYTLSTTTPWTASAGSITSGGVVASAPTTAAVYTASFTTAYKVTLVLNGCVAGQTAPAGLSPGNPVFVAASGQVQVIISAAASLPNVFQNFVVTPSTNATIAQGAVTINPLTAPVTITANCAPPPNVVFALTSRTGGNLSMDVSNTSATTATNVKILSITNITPSSIAYDPLFFSFPVNVPGGASVPMGGHGGFNLLFETNGSTSFTTSFSFLITASADNEAQFTQTITVP
jgi:hypothetical protein